MDIQGFQKMTLLDFPGKVAATVFLGGCNLRCPFCHNASLVTHIDPSAACGEDEVLSYLTKRRGILDGICVTGGEPLLRTDVAPFLEKVKALGLLVKLDTNGTFPDRLRALVAAELVDYVAIDVKNSKDRYAATVGIEDFDVAPIGQTLQFLRECGVPYELRTTVVREFHDVEAIQSLAEWIAGAPRYYLQTFTDSGDLISRTPLHPVPRAEMEEMAKIARKYVAEVNIRG